MKTFILRLFSAMLLMFVGAGSLYATMAVQDMTMEELNGAFLEVGNNELNQAAFTELETREAKQEQLESDYQNDMNSYAEQLGELNNKLEDSSGEEAQGIQDQIKLLEAQAGAKALDYDLQLEMLDCPKCDYAQANEQLRQAQAVAAALSAIKQQQAEVQKTLNLCDFGMCVGNVYNKGKDDPVGHLGGNILRFLLYITAAFAVLTFIVGGVMMMTAFGDEGQLEKGKKVLLYAVVGTVIVFAAYVIVSFVQQVLYSLGR